MNFLVDQELDEHSLEVNVTSFIDVLFTLLLFFMVSSSFADSHGVDIKLPSTASGTPPGEQAKLSITINREGKAFADKDPQTIEQLQVSFQALRQSTPNPTLIIRADQDTPHGKVIEVMDTARTAGIENIAIATMPKG
jgi:biopolymer transport protein ExbD